MPKSTALVMSIAIVSTVLLTACSRQPETTITPAPDNQVEQGKPADVSPEEMKKTEDVKESSDTMEKDKSLTTKTKYNSPAGEEEVGFTVTIDDTGIITDAKIEMLAKAPISKVRQEAFGKDFPAAVKGKKLSELTKIDRVGGSSLTTGAFNSALSALKAQM